MFVYSVIWHCFSWKILILSTKYCQFVINWSELVDTDTLLALYKTHKKNCFGGHFVFFFWKAVSHNFQSYQQILLISASKHRKEFYFHVLRFEENRSTIATVITTTCRYSVKKFMKQLEFQNLNIDIRHVNIWNE